MNEKCLDYNTQEKQKTMPGAEVYVNENVCASIVMNFVILFDYIYSQITIQQRVRKWMY